jgi:hypothetical protein
MGLDRIGGDAQGLCDFPVAFSLYQQMDNFLFPCRNPLFSQNTSLYLYFFTENLIFLKIPAADKKIEVDDKNRETQIGKFEYMMSEKDQIERKGDQKGEERKTDSP